MAENQEQVKNEEVKQGVSKQEQPQEQFYAISESSVNRLLALIGEVKHAHAAPILHHLENSLKPVSIKVTPKEEG